MPVATTYKGNLEPTQIIPETFRANQPGNGTSDDVVVVPPAAGVPAATVVVPRRNNGPLISVTGTTGLSVQFTGFSPTREVDFFRRSAAANPQSLIPTPTGTKHMFFRSHHGQV